jgi:NADH-quinone oxidoreductase subunit G
MPDEALTITVNGRQLEARPGELVIDAAERGGVYIPRFCYHPRMRPVGMCRMCIVEIDTGRGPALLPSCMIPVAPDMKVDTQSPTTVKAQDGVLEFLLVNHPLDCPVCDKGGECPLQDQTLAYGPGESRFVEEKRHFEKPIAISDTVLLDRERCILCDRCTRFAKEVAGDPLISFIDRGGETQVNTFPDHPFASYFSGNTVQICPVGALTARPYRFRARPWDLVQTESTCTSCAVGCRVVVDASRNRVLRYNGVDIDPVNWGWLCDKGRFDFEAVHHKSRLGSPLLRPATGDELTEAGWGAALGAAAEAIGHGIEQSGPGGVAVLGGARLTNEDAYAWAKLAKSVIGTDHVDAQLGDGLPAELVLGLPRATIDEALAPGSTVVLLGPDLKEELPVLFLRLRHAVENDGVKVVELSPRTTNATALATVSVRHQPGHAVALVRCLLGDGPVPPGTGDQRTRERAAELLRSGPVTVVVGRSSLAETAEPTVAAVAELSGALEGVRFLPALRRANVHGALDMGLAPGILPGRVDLDGGRAWYERPEAWGSVPAERGLDATGILTAAAEGRIDTLILLGADPLVDFPDRRLAARAVAGARTVIACDQFLTLSAAQADVVLPAAGYAECDGTTTNLEGRISTVGQTVTPPGTARSDWMIAAELAFRLGADLGLESAEDVWDEVERLAPSHAGITSALLRSPSAADGVVAPLTPGDVLAGGTPVGVEGSVLDGSPTSITGEAEAGTEPAAEAHAEAAAAADDTPTDQADSAARTAEAAREEEATPTGEAPPEPEDRTEAGVSEGSRRPPLLRFRPSTSADEVPAMDSYSLRLVVSRRLYDGGTLVQHAPSLAGLARPATLGLHPADLSHFGLAPGTTVKLTAPAGSMTAEVGTDPMVPRGVASVPFNQEGLDAGALIDITAPVTDVRVEST